MNSDTRRCTHCSCSTTPLWRRYTTPESNESVVLCNACWVYAKRHGSLKGRPKTTPDEFGSRVVPPPKNTSKAKSKLVRDSSRSRDTSEENHPLLVHIPEYRMGAAHLHPIPSPSPFGNNMHGIMQAQHVQDLAFGGFDFPPADLTMSRAHSSSAPPTMIDTSPSRSISADNVHMGINQTLILPKRQAAIRAEKQLKQSYDDEEMESVSSSENLEGSSESRSIGIPTSIVPDSLPLTTPPIDPEPVLFDCKLGQERLAEDLQSCLAKWTDDTFGVPLNISMTNTIDLADPDHDMCIDSEAMSCQSPASTGSPAAPMPMPQEQQYMNSEYADCLFIKYTYTDGSREWTEEKPSVLTMGRKDMPVLVQQAGYC